MANNLSIGISELSYDIASNTSLIRVSVTAVFQYYASCTYATSATVSIDGVSIGFNAPSYNVGNGGSVLIGTFDRTIAHNADGTRSVGASASWTPPYVYPGGLTFSGSASIDLTTIPRASSFSISGSTLGSAMSVSISRASSNFTHTVRYLFGSISRDYARQTTSCSFTPPLSDASQIPSAVSGTGTITVYTYSGGTMIGSKSSSFTLNLPSTVVPAFSALSISRIDNGVPSAWNTYVQGISKATLSIAGASGVYGSSISSYSITGGGYSGTNTVTTGTFGSGVITFTGTITDSRGRTTSKTVSITVLENRLPSLSIKAERCDINGKVTNDGTYIKISPTYSCSSINSNNLIATKSFTITGTSYTNTTCGSGSFIVIGGGTIAVSKSYEVSGIVSDTLKQSSGTIKVVIPSSSVPMNIRDDGAGIGFGKYNERKNAIDSNWDIVTTGNVTCSTLYPSNIQCVSSNELTFKSGNKDLCFGYRTPSGGTAVTDWHFFTGQGNGVKAYVHAGSYICDNWFRSLGETGWYNQTYSGGLYMADSSWVRTYNGKGFNTMGGAAWIGRQYASGAEWFGFYNTYSGTRKGWIGHDGSDTFHVRNEAGPNMEFNGTGGMATMIHGSIEVHAPQPFIDFHFANDGSDFSTRIICHGYGAMGYYGSWNALSDRRKKRNISSLSKKYIDLLMLLEPCKFIYNYNSTEFDKYTLGYIAQDVIKAIKEVGLEDDNLSIVVYDEKNDTYSLSYNDIEPIHTLAIQNLMKEVEQLKNKNQNLLSRIEKLESFMNEDKQKIEDK